MFIKSPEGGEKPPEQTGAELESQVNKGEVAEHEKAAGAVLEVKKMPEEVREVVAEDPDLYELPPELQKYYKEGPTSVFPFENVGSAQEIMEHKTPGFYYSGARDPKVSLFERKIINREKGAEAALATPSGMAAVSIAVLGFVRTGERILASQFSYPGTNRFFDMVQERLGIEVTKVDPADTEKIREIVAQDKKVKMVFFETPSNPTLQIFDIEELSRAAKLEKEGAAPRADVLVVVDNTFATPVLQNPLEQGADLVVHSASKYISEGKTIGGVVLGRNEKLIEQIQETRRLLGTMMSPETAWLLQDTIEGLEDRMAKHVENAKAVAEFLAGHRKVKSVYYPGFESHPRHEVAKRQMRDFGGMVGFELKGGFKAGAELMEALKLCKFAVSLGHKDSLALHFASLIGKEKTAKAGFDLGFVRFSAGLEKKDDILKDLEQALKGV